MIAPQQPVSEPLPETPPPPPAREVKRFVKEVLQTLLLAVALFLVINLVSARVRVEGYSMLPTLDNNQYVLVSRLTPSFGQLHRGDIIVFRPPMHPTASWLERLLGFPTLPGQYEDYIKRVIGLPGETVSISGGQVSIDGLPLDEPYIAEVPRYQGEWLVPADMVFVLGDNRNSSSDSHSWSFLPIENILGKAVLIYWPFSNWSVISNQQAALAAP